MLTMMPGPGTRNAAAHASQVHAPVQDEHQLRRVLPLVLDHFVGLEGLELAELHKPVELERSEETVERRLVDLEN